MDRMRELRPDPGRPRDLIRRGVAHPGQGSEALEEGLLPGRTDAGNLVERRHQRALRPLLPVVRDGEPVRFVADVLQHEQRLGCARDQQGVGPAGEVHLFQPLGQADVRDVQPEVGEHLAAHAELPLPAVDDDERRRIRESPLARRDRLVPLADQPVEPPPEHLLHAGEVVLPGNALDLELAVVAPLGQTVLEHHHGADRVALPQVGDVVALDPKRRLRQAELVGELGEGAGASPEVRRAPQLVPMERVRRVLVHDLHELALGAALRDADRHLRSPARDEPGLAARRDRRAASGPGRAAGPRCRSM